MLGGLKKDELIDYFTGLGWRPEIVEITSGTAAEHQQFADALEYGILAAHKGQRRAVVLHCVKGWGCPDRIGDRQLIGTSAVHKAPLRNPRRDSDEFTALDGWLRSYRPAELFDVDASPRGMLATAVKAAGKHSPGPKYRPGRLRHPMWSDRPKTFPDAVVSVVRQHAAPGDLRLFSPDELESNRLTELAGEPYTVEILAEELCLAWLEGWIASGRRGLLISYDAFASLMATGLVQHLKVRREARETGTTYPSLNLLLTSYGWHNTYTHGDPSLTTVALAMGDPAVRVLTPADPARVSAELDGMLGSVDQVNILVAGKRPLPAHPIDTREEELRHGLAIWPHVGDVGEPDLVLAGAGDLPAAVLTTAMPHLRAALGARLRYVHIHDMTVLGDPAVWPKGLSDGAVRRYLGQSAPVLMATLGHPAAVWGLLAGRWQRPLRVLGWRDPPGPVGQDELLVRAGLDARGILSAATDLLRQARTSR